MTRICMHCKTVIGEKGEMGGETHGICDHCLLKHWPEEGAEIIRRRDETGHKDNRSISHGQPGAKNSGPTLYDDVSSPRPMPRQLLASGDGTGQEVYGGEIPDTRRASGWC